MLRSFFFWLSGLIGVLLLLELLFRVLPVSSSTETGYFTDPLILSYPPQQRWTASTGWDLRNAQTLLANNWGYAAARDFSRNEKAVALVGDSFTEASMLAAADRPGAQLERALGGRPVYAMGMPGTALLDYAERIRFAQVQFGVRDFVVLMERGDVMQSLCGSGNVHGPCLDAKTLAPRTETLPPPSKAKQVLRHSALAQYLFSQLKFNPQRLWPSSLFTRSQASPVATPGGAPRMPSAVEAEATLHKVDVVTRTFFERIQPYVAGRLVIVLDSDRSDLQQAPLKPDPPRARFIALARAAGATVIDTAPLYQAHGARSALKLDVGPYDGHLNALGVRLTMQAAASALQPP